MKIILVHDGTDLVAALAENDDEADTIAAQIQAAFVHDEQQVTVHEPDTLHNALRVLS